MLADTLTTIAENTEDDATKNILLTLIPYIPAIQKAGQEIVGNIVKSIVEQDWQTADEIVWQHLSDNERDSLNDTILQNARDAVDRAYERNKMAKEIAIKVVISLALSVLAL